MQHLEVWEYFVYVDDPAYMFFDFVHQQIAYFDAFSEHTANLEKSKKCRIKLVKFDPLSDSDPSWSGPV